MNVCNRMAEEKRQQRLFEKIFCQSLHFKLNFTPKQVVMLKKNHNNYASNSLVTFVTRKYFAIIYFLPSCCINSLIMISRVNVKCSTPHPLKDSSLWGWHILPRPVKSLVMILSFKYSHLLSLLVAGTFPRLQSLFTYPPFCS